MLKAFGLTTSSFKRLREKNYLYVDKTELLYKLIVQAERSFLARPRRFGKSLLVSTLESILKGEKELFNGLWISASNYQWKQFGVIKLNFSSIEHATAQQVREGLIELLVEVGEVYQIEIEAAGRTVSSVLRQLTKKLFDQYGQVALLVDEYDHPILHSLDNPQKAEEILGVLRDFFTTVKALDNEISFFFATGVSAFARAGIFSGMNNLRMLSMEKEYAPVCGYTEQEIDTYFTSYVQAWADKKNISAQQVRENIKKWYNGYHFGKEAETVYNPFSLMHALEKKDLRNFWFESGNPTFLVQELKRRQSEGEELYFEPNSLQSSATFLGSFEIRQTPLETLLFQTGYVTITGINELNGEYILNYPNYEIATSFQTHLLTVFSDINAVQATRVAATIAGTLRTQNISAFVDSIKILFAQVPYQLHISKESFYHALLQIALGAAGFRAQSEYATNQGRIDLVVETQNTVYIIEVKLDCSAESALTQIKEKKYYERFLQNKKQIILIGFSFQREPGKFDILWTSEAVSHN